MDKMMSNMEHETHVMQAIHAVEDYAIDMVTTLEKIPSEDRCGEQCRMMGDAADMLKDMMEARAYISKIRHYANIASHAPVTGGEKEPWEHSYAMYLEDIEALVYNMRCWMKYRDKAAMTGDMTYAKTAEKHLAAAFASHSALAGKVMKMNATEGEKVIIANHMKAHA